MTIVKVLLPVARLFPLDYLVPEEIGNLAIGDLVLVPFRNQEITGIVWEIDAALKEVSKLKAIKQKLDAQYKIQPEILRLLQKASNYYLSELGSIAKLALPVDITETPIKIKKQIIPDNFNLSALSDIQNKALQHLVQATKPVIIQGVTGSGKTEVYFHLLADYLRQGRQVVIMLPEIALSGQIIKRFTVRFGFEPVVWNSTITKAQKKMALRGILNGEVKIVIGARSSLFLPYKDLGLIVVDEEHDSSYKQDDGILYNARDMAVLRASLSACKVLLCSATPSIETLHNANIGKYELIKLESRYQQAAMPDVGIINMKAEALPANSWISKPLITAIRQTLEKKEQVLLFLNRRGYAPLILCKLCGYRFTCPSCSAWLVLHKATQRLECHHCGHQVRLPKTCPECKDEHSLTSCGPGIERIEEEAKRLFPDSCVAVVSKDQMTKPQKMQELLESMENQEIDILIGTQMITKGYHFPNLTLVGVIDADLASAGGADLRASERTYQLLHQVGGRAGREQKKGFVLLQTYYPESIVLETIKAGDTEGFIKYEMNNRESGKMPPFAKMAAIILTGKNEAQVAELAKQLVAIAPKNNADNLLLKILGPAPALMSKVAGKYRYRILIIADKKFNLQKYLSMWLGLIKIPSSCHVKVDIDPQNFS